MKKIAALLFILSIPFSANAGYSHQSQDAKNCAIGVFVNYLKSQVDVTSFKLSATLSRNIEGVDKVSYGYDNVIAWVRGEIKERGKPPVTVNARFYIDYDSNRIVDKLGRETFKKYHRCDLNSTYATHDQSGESWFKIVEPGIVSDKIDMIY